MLFDRIVKTKATEKVRKGRRKQMIHRDQRREKEMKGQRAREQAVEKPHGAFLMLSSTLSSGCRLSSAASTAGSDAAETNAKQTLTYCKYFS